MSNNKGLKETLEKVNPGNYDMTMPEINEIYNLSNKDCFLAIDYAFRFGFLKGQRAAKAEQKQK